MMQQMQQINWLCLAHVMIVFLEKRLSYEYDICAGSLITNLR